MAAEEWRILISEAPAEGGAAAVGGAPTSDTTESKDIPRQQKAFFDQFSQYWRSWRPFIMTGGLLYGMYKSSQIVSETMKAIWQIFGAIMDVILAPLIPLITRILKGLADMVPVIADLAIAFFTPIVEVLVPIVEHVLEWIRGIKWERVEGWLIKAGEFVAKVITDVYNWMAGTLWPWIVTNMPKVWNALESVWNWAATTLWPWIETNMPKVWGFLGTIYDWIVAHIPTLEEALGFIWEKLNQAYTWLSTEGWEKIVSIYNWMKDTAGPWIAAIPSKIVELKEWFVSTFWPTAKDILTGILTVLGTVAGALVGGAFFWPLGALIGLILGGQAGHNVGDYIGDQIGNMGSELASAVNSGTDKIVNETSKVVSETSSVKNAVLAPPKISTTPIPVEVTKPVYTVNSPVTSMSTPQRPIYSVDLETLLNIKPMQSGGFVPKSGLYYLHYGEEVVSASKTRSDKITNNYIDMHNAFNIELQATGSVDMLAREIEEKITDKLTTIIRRI